MTTSQAAVPFVRMSLRQKPRMSLIQVSKGEYRVVYDRGTSSVTFTSFLKAIRFIYDAKNLRKYPR